MLASLAAFALRCQEGVKCGGRACQHRDINVALSTIQKISGQIINTISPF
jgi:hypothetical protein